MKTDIRSLIRRYAPKMRKRSALAGAPAFLPIMPTSRLWLPKLGIGNEERFARIFRDTWRKLPLRARRLLVRYWRGCCLEFPIGRDWYWSPLIELTDLCVGDLAWCRFQGHALFFYAPVVDAMPNHHVEELIAHELAHVAAAACGDWLSPDPEMPRWADYNEIIADENMEMWGFDPDALDGWVQKNWTWPDENKRKSDKRSEAGHPSPSSNSLAHSNSAGFLASS